VTVVKYVAAGLLDEESLLIFIFDANPASSYSCLFLLLTWLYAELGGADDSRQVRSDTDLPPIPSCYMLYEVRYRRGKAGIRWVNRVLCTSTNCY